MGGYRLYLQRGIRTLPIYHKAYGNRDTHHIRIWRGPHETQGSGYRNRWRRGSTWCCNGRRDPVFKQLLWQPLASSGIQCEKRHECNNLHWRPACQGIVRYWHTRYQFALYDDWRRHIRRDGYKPFHRRCWRCSYLECRPRRQPDSRPYVWAHGQQLSWTCRLLPYGGDSPQQSG